MPKVGVGTRKITLLLVTAAAKLGWEMLHTGGASVRPLMVYSCCTEPSRTFNGVPVESVVRGKRASSTGPFGRFSTKDGMVLVALCAWPTVICGLPLNCGVPCPGLVPPMAGCEGHMKQLLPLNLGPRPLSGSGLLTPGGAPTTEAMSPNLAMPASQKLNWLNVRLGKKLPEELKLPFCDCCVKFGRKLPFWSCTL